MGHLETGDTDGEHKTSIFVRKYLHLYLYLYFRQYLPPCDSFERLGDILSLRQIVPPAFFGRQIVPDDKMSHFLPMRQIVPATKCPISSPATKCPIDALIKTIVSLAFFRRQTVPLSPRRQNVPTYALMHRKVMESCWDILSVVPLC